MSWSTRIDVRDVMPFQGKEACNVCGKSHDFNIVVEQDYFVLYGLRLFPLKKRYVSECLGCKRRKKIELNDKNGVPDPKYLAIEQKKYGHFRYYSGWIVLAVLAGFILWLYLYMTRI